MRRMLIFLILIACLCSCSATKHIADSYYGSHNDSSYSQKERVDSVFIRDSIYIREKGDTVFKYVEKWRVRDRIVRDTLIVSQTDTVFMDKTEVQYVDKDLTSWQKWKMRGFWIYTAAILILLLWKYRSFLLGLLKKILPL